MILNISVLLKHFEAFNYFQKHLVLCLLHSENVWVSGKGGGQEEKLGNGGKALKSVFYDFEGERNCVLLLRISYIHIPFNSTNNPIK